ncbi:hypothetical protein [Alloactinosynnema sp. L-07]|nr:hypothetical protein [Alloactinosynnema sp. L-07]
MLVTGTPEIAVTDRCVATEDITGVIAKNRSVPWLQTVLAAWFLVRNPAIVEITEQHPSRPERRRAARAGSTLQPVRVVSVNRRVSANSPRPAESGRTVNVRFPVTGHWRDQAYGAGRALRRRMWIKEHWRGSPDDPVRDRPRVTAVEAAPDSVDGQSNMSARAERERPNGTRPLPSDS